MELALDGRPVAPDLGHVATDGDLLYRRPALNPVTVLLSHNNPVHRIGPRFQPTRPGPHASFIIVYRNLQDDVRFVTLNATSARLVALLHGGTLTGHAALDIVVHELRHRTPEVFLRGGRKTLENLRFEQAILGTWRD